MGNTQSAEAPRKPPNRLSKPRTNSSTPNLLITKTPSASRRNSLSSNVSPPNNPYSTASVVEPAVSEAPEKVVKDELKQRKRTSIFRSKSAQEHVPQMEIVRAGQSDFPEPLPVERFTRSSSRVRSDSITFELPGDQQRFSTSPLDR